MCLDKQWRCSFVHLSHRDSRCDHHSASGEVCTEHWHTGTGPRDMQENLKKTENLACRDATQSVCRFSLYKCRILMAENNRTEQIFIATENNAHLHEFILHISNDKRLSYRVTSSLCTISHLISHNSFIPLLQFSIFVVY